MTRTITHLTTKSRSSATGSKHPRKIIADRTSPSNGWYHCLKFRKYPIQNSRTTDRPSSDLPSTFPHLSLFSALLKTNAVKTSFKKGIINHKTLWDSASNVSTVNSRYTSFPACSTGLARYKAQW